MGPTNGRSLFDEVAPRIGQFLAGPFEWDQCNGLKVSWQILDDPSLRIRDPVSSVSWGELAHLAAVRYARKDVSVSDLGFAGQRDGEIQNGRTQRPKGLALIRSEKGPGQSEQGQRGQRRLHQKRHREVKPKPDGGMLPK